MRNSALPVLYHDKAGVPEGVVGYVFLFASVSALVGAAVGGNLADRLSRPWLCIGGVAGTLLPIAATALVASRPESAATFPSIVVFRSVLSSDCQANQCKRQDTQERRRH